MKSLLASLLLIAAAAVPAAAGPDFSSVTPTGKLAASSAVRPMLPTDDVVFENDSTALLSSGQQQLAVVARWMKNNPRESIVLEGHANSLGAAAYNEDLAARRAQQVRLHLMAYGIPSDKIVVVVFGESEAQPQPNPIDRRVVMYASHAPVQAILRASLGRGKAMSASWTKKGVQFTEILGTRTGGAVATR